MNTVTKQQAENLATEYGAFREAYTVDDDLGISVWGKMLLNSQRALGIELYTDELLVSIIAMADRKLKQREAA